MKTKKIILILAIFSLVILMILPLVLADALDEAKALNQKIVELLGGGKTMGGEPVIPGGGTTADKCAQWGGFKKTIDNKYLPLPTPPQTKIITEGDKAFECIKGMFPNLANNIVCCKEIAMPADTCKPAGGTCTPNACDPKTETEKTDLKCPTTTDKCCIKKTCEELDGTKVTKTDEQDKCKQPTLIIQAGDVGEKEICCVPKEPSREAPKKPGTLGRLQVCIGRYWLWGVEKDTEFLDKASTSLSGVSGIDSTKTKLNDLKTNFKNYNSAQKSDKIDEINTELFNARKKVVEGKTGDTLKTAQEQQQKMGEAQDSLEKARAIHTMAWPEIAANIMACALATYKAGTLSLQGGDNEMGSCNAEQPLKGTDYCTSCNEDPLRLCTSERCLMLGNCIPVPTSKADQFACIPGKCEDTGIPIFTEGKAEWWIDGTMNGSQTLALSGGNIRAYLNSEKPIPFNTKTIVLNVTTDKPAQCRYIVDTRGANFSQMQDFEENYFPTKADGTGSWQLAHVSLPGDIARNAEHRIFIKCKNACGVEPSGSYDQNIVSFKLDKKPDQLPPEIVYVDPANKAMVRDDLAILNASFWLDEKGSCKFSDKSINFTIQYTGSGNVMIPFGKVSPNPKDSSVVAGGCYLGKCLDRNDSCSRCWLAMDLSKGYELINFSSSEFNETRMFNLLIRCNDVAGNIMTEDNILDYTLMTAPGYNISIIEPEDGSKTYERSPEIEVTSDPRLTECRYKTYIGSGPKTPPAWDEMWAIDEEFAILHQGKHNETLNGSKEGMLYTTWARCRDTWHIEATDSTRFYVLLDEQKPIIIRMYHDITVGDYLVIETDEESECVYGTSDTIKCAYNFSDGSAFTTSDMYLHAAYWQLSSLYYIKCKDKWNNYPGKSSNANQCTAIINPYEVPIM